MISSVHVLGDHSAPLKNPEYNAAQLPLTYNWWSWYTRLAFPEIRKEAITSRPLLLSAIGRSTKHAGQTHLYLTPMHAAQKKVGRGIKNIRNGLQTIRQTAERLLGANAHFTDRGHPRKAYILGVVILAQYLTLHKISSITTGSCDTQNRRVALQTCRYGLNGLFFDASGVTG